MRLLVLGGTVFLGRHVTELALKAGHEVTLFNRGRSAPKLFSRVKTLIGDRGGDLSALDSGSYDAAIDTSGYFPSAVETGARLLKDRVGSYLFVSSVSVYRDWGRAGELREPPAVEPDDLRDDYGGLKVGCERAVIEAFGERSIIVRPGLIVGPHDPSDRFTYWPSRVARGGEVLAPGDPGRRVQVLDVRDLAAWMLKLVAKGKPGTYDACGRPAAMRHIMSLCKEESGSDASFTWVDEVFLEEQGALPYTDMPLWVPGIDDAFKTAKARAAGLNCRTLKRTIRDTRRWDATRPADAPRVNGITAEREAELLRKWKFR